MAWFQSHSLWVQEFADGLAALHFDPPGKHVRLTREVLDELDAALIAIEKEPRFRAVVIRSRKAGRFAVGLDVPSWKAMHAAGEIGMWCDRGQAVWNRLHGLKIPSIAWVSGSCLGAGLELALACDQILVVDQPDTVLAFNELDLGLIPSWGGVGPLVRRVGIQNALPIALAGRRLNARDALDAGLADRLSPSDDPDFDKLLALAVKRDPSRWSHRTWRQAIFERFAAGRRLVYRGAEKLQNRRLPDDLPAPRTGLETLKTFVEQGIAQGQTAAKMALAELADTRTFGNFVRLHELRERAGAISKASAAARKRTTAILGATPVGMHVLAAIARTGGSVVLRETDESWLGMAILTLVQSLGKDIQSGKMSPQDSKTALGRIRSTVSWKNFDEIDWALDTRSDALEQIEEVGSKVAQGTPIAVVSNSGRLETALANVAHPERVVGVSVPLPVGDYPMVEWRRGPSVSDAAARTVREQFAALGFLPIMTADRPGLLHLRMWAPAWNEMVLLIREGCWIELIDKTLLRFGFARGPLEYLDRVGFEQAHRWMEAVRGEIEPRVPVDSFWAEVLERGWKGRHSGKGFYRHGRGPLKQNHLLMNWLTSERSRPSRPAAEQMVEIRERIVLLMVNEAFRCLQEGRVSSADDLDLAMMLTDWASHRGGPIGYARGEGLGAIIERLKGRSALGPRFEPCERLIDESRQG